MRLLPRDPEIGWTPYAWLIYSLMFATYPLVSGGSPADWLIVAFGLAIFLPVYFWGFWLRGERKLWAAALLAALACVLFPWNQGASVFFVYAASFIGETGKAGLTMRLLAVLCGAIAVEAFLVGAPPMAWVPSAIFSIIIGGVCLHSAQRREAGRKLELAQSEIEHLAKVAERERIGRDLHDLLGHTLSLIVLRAELAGKLAEKDPSRALGEIREIEGIARQALAEVRSAVAGYRSAGLASEFQNAQRALATAGIQAECSLQEVRVAASHEGVLALALREAVTNVVRHAGATSCRIALRQCGAACELEVADDGHGFQGPEGFGLSGMRQRVEAFGGTFEFDSTAGARLLIRLPVEGAA